MPTRKVQLRRCGTFILDRALWLWRKLQLAAANFSSPSDERAGFETVSRLFPRDHAGALRCETPSGPGCRK
jgi:hypothetical protein